jgi:hypothetical protein
MEGNDENGFLCGLFLGGGAFSIASCPDSVNLPIDGAFHKAQKTNDLHDIRIAIYDSWRHDCPRPTKTFPEILPISLQIHSYEMPCRKACG